MPQPFNPFEEVPQFFRRSQTSAETDDSWLDPYADLTYLDGRRYRIVEYETCVREGQDVRHRFGREARFAIDMEVQLVDAPWGKTAPAPPPVDPWEPRQEPERYCYAHALGFCIVVSWDAIKSGVLEAHGYRHCSGERPRALLVLARHTIHRFLANAGGGGRQSAHTRTHILWVESLYGGLNHDSN